MRSPCTQIVQILTLLLLISACDILRKDGQPLDLNNNSQTSSVSTGTGTNTAPGTALFIFAVGPTSGNLGGRTGADSMCATTAPLQLTCANVHAFMDFSSTDTMTTAFSSLPNLPVRGPTGTPIADNFPNFVATKFVSQNTDLVSTEVMPSSAFGFWSGASADGSYNTSNNCSDWTSNSKNLFGENGDSQSGLTFWSGSSATCDGFGQMYLLCGCW